MQLFKHSVAHRKKFVVVFGTSRYGFDDVSIYFTDEEFCCISHLIKESMLGQDKSYKVCESIHQKTLLHVAKYCYDFQDI